MCSHKLTFLKVNTLSTIESISIPSYSCSICCSLKYELLPLSPAVGRSKDHSRLVCYSESDLDIDWVLLIFKWLGKVTFLTEICFFNNSSAGVHPSIRDTALMSPLRFLRRRARSEVEPKDLEDSLRLIHEDCLPIPEVLKMPLRELCRLSIREKIVRFCKELFYFGCRGDG